MERNYYKGRCPYVGDECTYGLTDDIDCFDCDVIKEFGIANAVQEAFNNGLYIYSGHEDDKWCHINSVKELMIWFNNK